MEFTEPHKIGFTVYSKSGCPNCLRVKRAIKEKKNLLINEIDCDEYLLENKKGFLSFIKDKMGEETECRVFPMVFFDGKFVGGYNETIQFIDKNLLSFEEIF